MTDSVFSAASCSCVRGASRWPCSVSLSRSFSVTFSPCLLSQPLSSVFLRVFLVFVDWQVPGKRHFATTFSNSLKADPPQRPLSPALPRLPVRKVPGEMVFLRHLLAVPFESAPFQCLPAGVFLRHLLAVPFESAPFQCLPAGIPGFR